MLDINLPDATGFEICQELRRTSTTPVIFASARTSETDRITGFDIGGDVYLPKPYSMKELSLKQMLVRQVIQLVLIEGVMLFLAIIGVENSAEKPLSIAMIGVAVAVIYALAILIMWHKQRTEAKKLTLLLKDFQNPVNK